jgi:V/A-type H+/Na+-transporting ATPase subunit B
VTTSTGRFFNSFGLPIDGGPEVEGEEREIGGPSVNPVRRKQPSELIATGIAGIDLNNTLVTGQKIPFLPIPTSLLTRLWPWWHCVQNAT